MTSQDQDTEYRVLARKYRSQSFSELIGQDALVQTLTNAITSGRIAQAYMLTGIRGVGKTSTARLIAKALNYKDGPTAGPTGDCPICQAITADRHPDVLEMDAASRTGIDDIREIIDGVRYAPTEARYKVYIIDEVHMLSKQAFNALLKTLEEPPPHVVFIFATTEIRKVPITILSRCQRFDLRRIDQDTLAKHYQSIADKEGVKIEQEALLMIARAADGSVRDGLSLLDQAIAMSEGHITAANTRDMLGLADQSRTTTLLNHILSGKTKDALSVSDELYKNGGNPAIIAEDLLGQIHILTRLQAVQDQTPPHSLSAETYEALQTMSQSLSMPTLARAWQLLLKGVSEIQNAPNPQAALDMVLIRMCYTADLPDPATLLKKLKDTPKSASAVAAQTSTLQSVPAEGVQVMSHQIPPMPPPVTTSQEGTHLKAVEEVIAPPKGLEDIVALLEQNGKFALASHVIQYVRLIRFEGLQLEYSLHKNAPREMTHELTQTLRALTGQRWLLIFSAEDEGAPTLAEQAEHKRQSEINAAKETDLVKNILSIFPDAEITKIYSKNNQEES